MEKEGAKSQIGNVVEWEDRSGNILFGKVINTRENVAIVDCTIMPNFHALNIEERQVVRHEKYKIVNHSIEKDPYGVVTTKLNTSIQKEEPKNSGFKLGELMKVKESNSKKEGKEMQKPRNEQMNTKPSLPNPQNSKVNATSKVNETDALFLRFGHTKEEYLKLAKTHSDKKIRELWDWDHNKINRFKHAHNLIDNSTGVGRPKQELTVQELNKKYGHTKEEYLELKQTHSDKKIQDLWGWDHNKIYRFKKVHNLTGVVLQSKPDVNHPVVEGNAKKAEPIVAKQGINPVGEEVKETTITDEQNVNHPVVEKTDETAEPIVAEQGINPVGEEVKETTTIEQNVNHPVAEKTDETAEPIVTEQDVHSVEEEPKSNISNQWLEELEKKDTEISDLKRTINQLQEQQNPLSSQTSTIPSVYQDVATAFVQLENALQEVANHSFLGNLLMTAITAKTNVNQPTKYK